MDFDVASEALWPSPDCLEAEPVLVQAWKKSQAHIRAHNWYADSLELDLTAFNLPEAIKTWRRVVASRRPRYRPSPMRLVLAPKAGRWTIPQERIGAWSPRRDWNPNCKDDDLKLRPLAHLRIMDQVLATAIMLCMADAVETTQRETQHDRRETVTDARSRGVVSYGNRLACRWEGGQARFPWGNGQTYRKYYEDYQAFVARPAEVARMLPREHTVAIVQLDLSSFYDHVDREELVTRLERTARGFYRQQTTPRFWEVVRGAFDWSWDRRDGGSLPDHLRIVQRRGLPQGLVASGFFANAYMLDFDARMRAFVDIPQSDFGWVVRDYCRYVDDLRLVVTYTSDVSSRMLREQVTR